MIDKSSLLKSQGSLYLEFIPKDGLFHKMLLLSLMGFLTGWCNLHSTGSALPVQQLHPADSSLASEEPTLPAVESTRLSFTLGIIL